MVHLRHGVRGPPTTSGLPRSADIPSARLHVSKVPRAEVDDFLFDH